ncbi:unnamed protein product, partial [Oppiella nova]
VPLVGSSPLFPHHEKTHFSHTRDESKEKLEFYGINLEPNYWPAIISVLKCEHRIQLSIVKRISNAAEGYNMLKALDREDKEAMKYVVLNCKLHISKALIAYHIQDTAMERHTFHYLLTNLVLSDAWAKEVPAAFNAVNITSFALPSDRNELKKLIQMKSSSANAVLEEEKTPSLEESLTLDSTRVLLQAFNLIIQSQINITRALETDTAVVSSTVNFTRKVVIDPTCPTLKPFKFGEIIASHLKITSMTGITGNIEFHSTGLRKNYTIEVFEISNSGNFEKEEPFLMLRADNGENLKGNDRFEGFAADLMKQIAETLGFQYRIQLVNDSKYGGFDGKSGWNGMIGQLIRHEVHMAIAPLTITHERASVVDFSHPFMTSGITMMFKKPSTGPQDMFPFVRPLSKEVWASIVLAVFVVTLIFYIVSKLSVDKNIPETTQTGNISLCSSLSYSVGVLVYQVSGVYPHSISSRIVSSVWWLFVFIVVTSYLSNLTANSVLTKMKFTLYHISGKYETLSEGFLYYDQMVVPISSFDDLAKQNIIEYGLLRNSSTEAYFRDSSLTLNSRMWTRMREMNDVFVDSYSEGVRKVRESDGKYVFLMESPANDYINDRQPYDQMVVPISSFDDLAKQNIIEYGLLRNSSTEAYFRDSSLTLNSRMWTRMREMNDVFVDSYSEGVRKVRESDGKYVFLMESPANDYINDRQPCNTYKVGKNLNVVEYGIALPRGSPLRDKVNLAIMDLKGKGVVAVLENKWWKDRSQCKYIDIKKQEESIEEEDKSSAKRRIIKD